MVAFQESTDGKAREILEGKIEAGRKSAMDLFERVHRDAPRDTIAKGKSLSFANKGTSDKVEIFYGDNRSFIHQHALSQLATRAGVPSTYLAELAGSSEIWKRDLAAEVLNQHYGKGTPDQRYLLRAVDGQVRGFLSDRYRRLDSRPLVTAFAEECRKVGAVPVDGTCSDTRVALKALLPRIYEPVPGEVLAFGIEWANSDFGNGKHAVRAFMMRVWCLNGATMENALNQVHLGRQLSDDIELSARTYELDTRTSISALKDVVAGTLSPRKVEQLCEGIKKAHAEKVDWKNVNGGLAKKLLKGELQAAKAAFDSPDVYNLPAGNSMWRVSNAISWIAGSTEDADRKLELQRLAGELVDGRRDATEKEAA
jgi:hypothetical protein